MPTWPDTLPQKVLRSGLEPALAQNTVRQRMEYGPDKVRKRKGPSYRPLQAEITMTQAQLTLLLNFFETTLQQGSIPFTWSDPVLEEERQFRFVDPPSWEPYGHSYKVRLGLEMQVPVEALRTVLGSD